MIVRLEDLSGLRRQVTMVDGVFDPLHHGHIAYFRAAAALGRPVLCNVASDDYVRRKHPPLLTGEQRSHVIDALRDIAYTHVNTSSTADVLAELQPAAYVKGADWRGRLPPVELEACRRHDIDVVYADTVEESSSQLLREFLRRAGGSHDLAAFEALVLDQRPIPSARYDRAYFSEGWRSEGETYTLPARREIEGRHPGLIKDVFQPGRVLDLGCGPGFLMLFLYELGVNAEGIDFSPASRELAPPQVRDRIRIAPVTDPGVPDGRYDLVICREVFEHLTVLEIRRAVAAAARASSRFVYVTTRFHPEPDHLLSVGSQFDVDPTHITLLHKDFLRMLFVLEGFRSRTDLEGRMDWQDKGRALVMEKQHHLLP